MHKIKKFIIDFWPSMLTLGVVLYLTLSSDPFGDNELPTIPYGDKLVHAIMMGGMVGAIAFDLQRRDRKRSILTSRLMWTLFGCICLFGIADEALQWALDNGRGAEAADYIADVVGGIVAVYTAPPTIRKVLGVKRQTTNPQ